MNPILYAFLSDNFKKSFMKACTCAVGKEMNAQLHIENSSIPRKRKAAAAAAAAGADGGADAAGGGSQKAGKDGKAGGNNGTRDGAGDAVGDRTAGCRIEFADDMLRVGSVRAILVDNIRFEDAGADITSDSMQTKSTATTVGTIRGDNSSDRPAVLHTDF